MAAAQHKSRRVGSVGLEGLDRGRTQLAAVPCPGSPGIDGKTPLALLREGMPKRLR